MSPGSPVIVRHGSGSYPVYIHPGILSQLELLISRHLGARRVVMIADEKVFQLYSSGRFGLSPWSGEVATFAPGESSKTRDTWAALTDDLLERRLGRDGVAPEERRDDDDLAEEKKPVQSLRALGDHDYRRRVKTADQVFESFRSGKPKERLVCRI